MFNYIFLAVCGASFGLMSAAGVFTVLIVVGLVPRFAGKTHTANKIFLYEEMVVFGTVTGCILSIFERYLNFGAFFAKKSAGLAGAWTIAGNIIIIMFGLFSGMFIGCLALAIAEMLDSIPIFARRVSFRHGIGIAVLAMAAGKMIGSLFYFFNQLYHTV